MTDAYAMIITGLERMLEHEILAGRRYVPMGVAVTSLTQPATEAERNDNADVLSAPAEESLREPAADAYGNAVLTACASCPCRNESPPVSGGGKCESPDFMFVCEYPAAGADSCGGLFAKADFELLGNMIKAMGTDVESVFITAAIKCRPPNKTAADSAMPCAELLAAQIAEIKPKCIIALGDYALRLLTGQPTLTARNEHGKLRKIKGIPLVPSFNPAYLNKFPAVKKDAWKDLKIAMCQI